jgi:hypothetical protein
LLADDWLSVVQEKADLYQGHLAAPLDVGTSGSFGQARTQLSVLGRTTSTMAQTSNIGFVLQVVNDGPKPVDLSQLALRYWFDPGSLGPAGSLTQEVNIDYAAVGAANVIGQVGPAEPRGSYALTLSFSGAAGSINAYSSSGDINVRIHKSDWSLYDQIDNFSFRPDPTLTQWDRVGLYRGGVLVWGSPPIPPGNDADVTAT